MPTTPNPPRHTRPPKPHFPPIALAQAHAQRPVSQSLRAIPRISQRPGPRQISPSPAGTQPQASPYHPSSAHPTPFVPPVAPPTNTQVMSPPVPSYPPQAHSLPQKLHPHSTPPPMTVPTETQLSYDDLTLAVTRVLTSVHAEIWQMHQAFVNEKEADMRACAKLTSELQHAWHEHRLAAKERARLESDCINLKTQMSGVMTEALRRGLEELADGNLARFAEISGRIDADVQDRISRLFSHVLQNDAQTRQGASETGTETFLRQRLKISFLASTSTPVSFAGHVPDRSFPNDLFSNSQSQAQCDRPTSSVRAPKSVIAREFEVPRGLAGKEVIDLTGDNSRPLTPVTPVTQASQTRPPKRRRKSTLSPRQESLGLLRKWRNLD